MITINTPAPHPAYSAFIDDKGIACLRVPCAPDAHGNTTAIHGIGKDIARGLAAQLLEVAEKADS